MFIYPEPGSAVQRLAARLGASVSPSKLRSPPLQTRSSYRSLPSHCKTGVIQALEQSCVGPRETLGMAERAFVEGGWMRLQDEVGPAICQPRAASTWSVEYPPSSVKIEEMQAMVVSGCLQLFRSIEERRCVSVFVANDVLEGCTTVMENYVLQNPLQLHQDSLSLGFADIRNRSICKDSSEDGKEDCQQL
jgi:hypothetical protein